MRQIYLESFESRGGYVSLILYAVYSDGSKSTLAQSWAKGPGQAVDLLLEGLDKLSLQSFGPVDVNSSPSLDVDPLAFVYKSFSDALNDCFESDVNEYCRARIIGSILDVTLWLNSYSEIVRSDWLSDGQRGS